MKKRDIIKTMKKLDSIPMPEKERVLNACRNERPLTGERKTAGIRAPRRRKLAVLAIAAALLIVGGTTVSASEAIQYGRAVDFFEEYDISRNGLTRSQVKKIYRDITTQSFTYEKTEQALASGLEGYEIQSEPLDPDELSRLWMAVYGMKRRAAATLSDAEYYYSHVMSEDESNPFYYDLLSKRVNGTVLWKKRFDNFYTEAICAFGDRILVAGNMISDGIINSDSAVTVCLINSDSSVAWQCEYNSDRDKTAVEYILREDDGFVMFAVSRDDLWIVKIGMDGKIISQEHIGCNSADMSIIGVTRVGGGYLFLTESGMCSIKNGKISDTVHYTVDGAHYAINGMIEYNGVVYLSGTVLRGYDPSNSGLRENYLKAYGKYGQTDENCLEFFKKNTASVLLVCDPRSGEALKFYTLPESAGSCLEIKEGRLVWTVNRYRKAELLEGNIDTHYIATGCFAELECDVWEYVFDPYGQLTAERDTRDIEIIQG